MARRLLLVLPVPARGGAEDYALTIGRAAVVDGWTVRGALPVAPETRTLRRDFAAAGVSLAPLRPIDWLDGDDLERAARLKLGAAAAFAAVVLRFRPDVVHVTSPWPTFGYPFLLTSAVLGLPTLVSFQLVPEGLFMRRRRLVYRWMRGRNQRWIAVSEHGRRVLGLLYGMDPSAIGVIHNGAPARAAVDGDGRPDAERASVRAELGLSAESAVLLSVGRLDAQKGQTDLVCAAAGVHAERPDVRVLIAGEGPERQRLKELIRAFGLIHTVLLLGHRTDVPRLMSAADVFVFPSHFEGTPFAMLEAMSHGLPVIAAAFGGAEEVLADGRTGILVPVGRSDALREAILGALGDPDRLARLAAAGRQRAAAFSREAMVAATLHELERLRASRT
jgi:glycosyltransferase involved in cell wall biosynthesis